MTFDPMMPYNDLPLLPPQAQIETRTVLKKAISAARALAELKGLGRTIPNQAMLVDSLVLQEAKDSSAIENIFTTNDMLFRSYAAKTSHIDPATKEVLRYREALWNGFESLKVRPVLSTNLLVKIVQTITENDAGVRNVPGTAIVNGVTGETIYTPPEGEGVLRDKLANLEQFMHADDGMETLVKLALIHYQFEAIHPFADGNGRTGRVLGILFLTYKGLLDLPVLYLSRYIIEHKHDYYILLRGVTEQGAWEPWILYMLDAVEQMSIVTRDRILAIRALMEQTAERVKKELPKIYSKELLELLFRQPYTKGQFVVDAGIAQRQTAAEYLKRLEVLGILRAQRV
ncbi:Fic family protein, partial [bacterium]|nr:Fic family protein [bacterium]